MGGQLDGTPPGHGPGSRCGAGLAGAATAPAGWPGGTVSGDQVGPYRRPSVGYERLAERTGEHPAPEWSEWPECMCGRVCVCRVPDGVVRSVASFVAEWHPTAVFDRSPAAERAEDATLCRCGQAFCGYRIFARTMRRAGAYMRA
ncbi:MAG TPA: hypothetical protein VFX70_09180 [Mycobacteriales bacterium]|nr:hypothetical protein [Mycobacteriales bacterium]